MLEQTILTMSPRISLSDSSPSKKRRKAITRLKPTATMPSAASPISANEVGRVRFVTLINDADLIAQIRGLHRQRQDFHRAEKSLTLQIKAIERRIANVSGSKGKRASALNPKDRKGQDTDGSHGTVADAIPSNEKGGGGRKKFATQAGGANVAFFATQPLRQALADIKPHRLAAERKIRRLAKQLPVWLWVQSIKGFGPLGLGQIIAEAGDLSLYANPAKLWKRMGLAVIDGKSQRRVKGRGAVQQGYSPVRRAIMFCIGDSLLKKKNSYRDLYLVRKVYETVKFPEGKKIIWHRRAQRYVEKRLLRDLWGVWRDTQKGMVPCSS